MTKDQELQILDQTIATLTPHSYCGPWLAYMRPDIERDMRADYQPSPVTPTAAYTLARDMVAAAETHAAEIIAAARTKAEQIKAEAHTDADRTRAHVRAHLARTLDTWNGVRP